MSLQAVGGIIGINGAPVGNGIKHIKAPMFPEFRFEYHPLTGKVYLIDTGRKPVLKDGQEHHEAEIIAEHCDCSGRAHGFVQTFLRGFRRQRGEIVAPVS